MFTRILVPGDGSPTAGLAGGAAIDLARACGAGIVALSVAVPEAPPWIDGGMVLDPGQQADAMHERARGVVDALAGSARRAGIGCIPVTRIAPDVARAIVMAAREYRCDLIVMGSHGRRGLGSSLAGSVTQEVLAEAPVPVLVLRPARSGKPARAPRRGGAGDRA